ncbi:MAG: N-hydroxyarylamine O-acetyltransferase [Acidobacteria bacterium OLB17]|nr:MAG: N-hydroxyarylamine O-acetyltransferase [Acidobacteria bacterium OLB17]MCZ2390634.1 arylamine N-acetyltransferase [Acidobacteriota bacterium]
METEKYLKRIGVDPGDLRPNIESLRMLQRAHLLSIPFENLDIHWKRKIVLDVERFYEKIVEGGRGGFCYELNGLFNELLVSLSFTTRLISARVARPDGNFAPEFGHAAIITSIGGEEYLTDVGFGDFTSGPLRLAPGELQQDANGVFLIEDQGGGSFLVKKQSGDDRKDQYAFSDMARDLSEFAEMCDFQQFSPESRFTKGKVCSLMTENGRKTLTDSSFIVTAGGAINERPVGTTADFDRILEDEFGICPPAAAG